MKYILATILFFVSFSSESTIQFKTEPELLIEVIEEASDTSRACLAAGIYHEARGESHKGMLAVGFVILNRARLWGATTCQVIMQKVKQTCQFSGLCKKRKMLYDERSLAIADKVMTQKDFTNGATYFHLKRVSPSWKYDDGFKATMKIGSHIFYRSDEAFDVGLKRNIVCHEKDFSLYCKH